MALARLPTYLEFGHMMGVITENPVRRDVRCRSGCTMSTRGRLLTRSVEHYRVVRYSWNERTFAWMGNSRRLVVRCVKNQYLRNLLSYCSCHDSLEENVYEVLEPAIIKGLLIFLSR